MPNQKNIIFLGYGIDSTRKEAVSINTTKLIAKLSSLNYKTYYYNIGYPNMFLAVLNRGKILRDVQKYIEGKDIAIVHDIFVLPLASLIFTLPLKRRCPELHIVKEIHNDAGWSHTMHPETLLRMLANRESMLAKVIRSFTCFTRNKFLADKYNLAYIPTSIEPKKYEHSSNNKIRISYIGHALTKKGVYEFPKLIKLLSGLTKYQFIFSCAFSDLGKSNSIVNKMQNAAKDTNITVKISNIVDSHQFFSEQDYYILPLQDEFGAISTPNTILEAMEAGAIPIVTSTNTTRAIIKAGETAYLLKLPTAQEIFNTLAAMLDNSEAHTHMRNRARAYIEKEYSDKISTESLINLYANEENK